jgi:ketosteroid isomerase-like protein
MKKILLSIIVMSILSCGGEQTNSELALSKKIDFEKELEEIEKLRFSFSLALKEGRFEDIGKWVTKNAKTIRAGGPGFDEMFELGKERGTFPYDSIIMKPTETHIMNDSMAYNWGSSLTYYTNKEGQQIELENSFLVILKKENGEWKLHREVASSVLE